MQMADESSVATVIVNRDQLEDKREREREGHKYKFTITTTSECSEAL